jgi:hypothetical protein
MKECKNFDRKGVNENQKKRRKNSEVSANEWKMEVRRASGLNIGITSSKRTESFALLLLSLIHKLP